MVGLLNEGRGCEGVEDGGEEEELREVDCEHEEERGLWQMSHNGVRREKEAARRRGVGVSFEYTSRMLEGGGWL